MNLPRRNPPVWALADRLRMRRLLSLFGMDLAYGFVTAFGKSEAATQVLLRQLVPTPIWAALLVTGALVGLFGWIETGANLCSLAWSMVTIAALSTIGHGTALSYAGPILLGWVVVTHQITAYGVSSGLADPRGRVRS